MSEREVIRTLQLDVRTRVGELSISRDIIRELFTCIRRCDGSPELLSIIGSYGDTLEDSEVLSLLRDYNSGSPVMKELPYVQLWEWALIQPEPWTAYEAHAACKISRTRVKEIVRALSKGGFIKRISSRPGGDGNGRMAATWQMTEAARATEGPPNIATSKPRSERPAAIREIEMREQERLAQLKAKYETH